MSYVVLIHPAQGAVSFEVRGPYRSFKTACADARAWDGVEGRAATVEPVLTPDGKPRQQSQIDSFKLCND